MAKLFANSEDLNQTWHPPASDLALHCAPFANYPCRNLQTTMG